MVLRSCRFRISAAPFPRQGAASRQQASSTSMKRQNGFLILSSSGELKTDDLHDDVVGRWFKQQNWNRILTTVGREIFFRPGGLDVVELRPQLASEAKPPGGHRCECQT